MADNTDSSRTEEPTPRRRDEAKKKGQVAHSQDLANGLVLLAFTGLLWFAGDLMGQNFVSTVRNGLVVPHHVELDPLVAGRMVSSLLFDVFRATVGVLAVFLAVALLGGVAQAGFNIKQDGMQFDPQKLSPGKGWSNIFSMRSAARGAMALFKLLVTSIAVWMVFNGRLGQISRAGSESLHAAVATSWEVTIRLSLSISASLVALGLADYLFQRWRHEESLKMSRQEIKDEMKQEEGDPLLKSHLKRLQRERTQQQILRDVPNATVVLTNPTHLAIAIRYERLQTPAPIVVAKGAGHLAKRIVKVARQNNIPVLERKPIARALYGVAEIGQEIPVALYRAVAEILAYVYSLRAA